MTNDAFVSFNKVRKTEPNAGTLSVNDLIIIRNSLKNSHILNIIRELLLNKKYYIHFFQ